MHFGVVVTSFANLRLLTSPHCNNLQTLRRSVTSFKKSSILRNSNCDKAYQEIDTWNNIWHISYYLSKVFQKDTSHIWPTLANCKGKVSDELILFPMATRLTLTDGPRIPCSTVGAACHAAGSGCSGYRWHWKLGRMPGNDSANACRTMVYTLRRGIGLFVLSKARAVF